ISSRRFPIESADLPLPTGVTMLTVRGAQPGPTLALLGGVHGDEWEGVAAVGRIIRLLHERAIRGTVRIVAVCNELAFEAMSRTAPPTGRDLARCFPGHKDGVVAERMAAVLTDEAIRGADFLIDLHGAGLHYTMPTLVGFIGGAGAAGRSAAQAAAVFGAPVVWGHPPPPPIGRTISTAFALGIPSLYAETTGAGELRTRDIECYTRGVERVMRFLGMLEGDAPVPMPALHLAGNGDLDTATVRARHAGLLLRRVEPLQLLEAGDEVGIIVDLAGEVVETLVTSGRGVVVMLRHTPRVVPGDRICHLADLEADR
ncbi:MAG: succinylglutamate desuccinylase/aspartoacylase family protein, partial [Chloroflexota bacterium]